MSRSVGIGKKQARADRLQREAANCVSVAVATREAGFAADLIDEAVRLARRSQEIGRAE